MAGCGLFNDETYVISRPPAPRHESLPRTAPARATAPVFEAMLPDGVFRQPGSEW